MSGRIVWCVMFLAHAGVFAQLCAGADAERATPRAQILAGSRVAVDDAAKHADLVVLATVESAEVGDPAGPGAADYALRVRVNKVLKGALKGNRVSFIVRVHTLLRGEEPPLEKRAYLFFLKAQPKAPEGWYSFVKMLDPTDENIKDVTERVARSASAKKP